jgi:very-short-patch-repair endonuclease
MEDQPGLAHILYDPVRSLGLFEDDRKQQSAGLEITLSGKTPFASQTIWVWLGEGRTHPKSEGEAKLAKALANDRELGALFAANQRIKTIYNNQPTVDLLWTQGRVVVEVDGDDHREASKFAADRRRDFELQISDYAVLRLINHEVLTDTPKAIGQIREFVFHRRKTRPDLVRYA